MDVKTLSTIIGHGSFQQFPHLNHASPFCETIEPSQCESSQRTSITVIFSVEFGYPPHLVIHCLSQNTSQGLKVMRGSTPATDEYNYINQSQTGRLLRSTSIYLFYNDDSVAVGSICVNLDITQLIATQNMIDTLIRASEDDISKQMASREIVTNDGNEMLDILIDQSIRYVGPRRKHDSREKNKRAPVFG